MEGEQIAAEVNAVQDEVWRRLTADNPQGPGMIPVEMAPYWQGHRPRFDLQVKWFATVMRDEPIELVADVGTGFPFATMYWAMKNHAKVHYGCPVPSIPCSVEGALYVQMNLCRELPLFSHVYDLVVCTECLEHLPCNIYTARNRLMGLMKKRGWLVLSFPLNGANAHNYHLDNPAAYDTISDAHIREFTPQTADEFCIQTGLDIVESQDVWSPAYGGVIKNVLLRGKP